MGVVAAAAKGTSFYLFTWGGFALDGSHAAAFNPDRSTAAERPWQLYRETLAAPGRPKEQEMAMSKIRCVQQIWEVHTLKCWDNMLTHGSYR